MTRALVLVFSLLGLSACAMRSISDSGPTHDPAYVGEIHDLNLLGTLEGNGGASVSIPKGASIVLMQSGRYYPDDAMMSAFEPRFSVLPLSGVPLNAGVATSWSYGYRAQNATLPGTAPTGLLCQRAARAASAQAIVVVWGVLEGAAEPTAGKAAVWIPIVGLFVPDETQRLRIRLKAALIDPATGSWRMVRPDELADSATSSAYTRDQSDQEQVARLKQQSYAALAKAIGS